MDRLTAFIFLVLGAAAMVASLTKQTITYRFSSRPFPNQRLARLGFLAIGLGFFLGGIVSLWIDWHLRR